MSNRPLIRSPVLSAVNRVPDVNMDNRVVCKQSGLGSLRNPNNLLATSPRAKFAGIALPFSSPTTKHYRFTRSFIPVRLTRSTSCLFALQLLLPFTVVGISDDFCVPASNGERLSLVTTKQSTIVKVHSIKQPHRARRQVVVRAMTQRVTRHLVSCRLSFRPRVPSQQSSRAGVIFL